MNTTDSDSYRNKKAFFDQVLTVYGRKPVLEALQDSRLKCYRLHLAESNKSAPIIDQITSLAEQRGAEVLFHDKRALSRISRNGKQDQGVAADILCPEFTSAEDFLKANETVDSLRLLALDCITNPANIGMIVRSAVAGGIDGILWARKGNAELGPLVIKASAGTLYRAPMVVCEELLPTLTEFQTAGYQLLSLAADAKHELGQSGSAKGKRVFVLGNESNGVSPEVTKIADGSLRIPMQNGVESLNVAVSAALIAYLER
jgi:23S rRNA (guanosine2251-2'-O)-methyltransferase